MAVVSAQVFALLLGIFSSLTQGKLTSYITVHENMKKEHVSITRTFHDATHEDNGVHCCEAVNKMGTVSRYLEVVVYATANTTFFGIAGNETGCLLRGTEAVLQCNAVGSSFLTVSILNPKGTEVGASSGLDHAEVAYPLPTATLTEEGTFVCHIRSNSDGEITKEYKFCLTPNSSRTSSLIIKSAAGGGGGLLIVFLLAVALIAYCRKRRRDIIRSNPEQDPLIPPPRLQTDDEIEMIAQIIRYDWVDVLRGIEPSFEDGDSFLRSVKSSERRGGEADSVIFCLKKWIEQNPRDTGNLLSAVCNAAEAADRNDLAEILAAKCQDSTNVGQYRALAMSSDFSSLRAATSLGSERRRAQTN